jgi:hypothetical protein
VPSLAPYQSPQARWIADAINYTTGFRVRVNPDLEHTCAIDFDTEEIEIQDNLSPVKYHLALSRAALRTQFERAYGREFTPDLDHYSLGGVVLPFPPGGREYPRVGWRLSS